VLASISMMQPRSASTHSKIRSKMRRSNWSMSSVWLTASAVRYITCKLLRARASHEFCGASAPAANTRLPSSWLTERTIRDPSVGSSGCPMRTIPAKSSRVSSTGPV